MDEDKLHEVVKLLQKAIPDVVAEMAKEKAAKTFSTIVCDMNKWGYDKEILSILANSIAFECVFVSKRLNKPLADIVWAVKEGLNEAITKAQTLPDSAYSFKEADDDEPHAAA